MLPVTEYIESQMTKTQFREIVVLINTVWLHPEKTIDQLVDEVVTFAEENPNKWIRRFVVWEKGKAISHSRLFPRTIFTDKGKIDVLALASVVSSPKRRGEGFGKAVVQKAFQFADVDHDR